MKVNYAIQESNAPLKYQPYKFAIPEGCTDQYEDNGDPTPGMVHGDLCSSKPNIKAGIIRDKTPINKTDGNNLLIKGPGSRIEITFSGLQEDKHDREFIIIQDSKRSLEMSCDRAIVREDFHENILNHRVAVLDTVGGIGLPYSTESCYFKLLADEKPPHEKILTLSDYPSTQLSFETKWGCLRNLERYQEFYVHVVRGDCYNGEWRYIELYTLMWYIYWNCRDNIYQCGIKKSDAVLDLSKININRTCNKDRFIHFIDLETNQFHIHSYPNYDCEKQFFEEIFTKLFLQETDYPERADGISIEVGLFEFTCNSTIPAESIHIITLLIDSNLLFLQNLERNNKFCSFILLEYWNNGDRKYVVLQTYNSNIYWKWFQRITGEKCEYSQRTLQNLLKIKIFRTSNETKFKIWIKLGRKMQFNIFKYPDFTFVEEIFRDKVKNAVIDTN